MNSPVGFSTTFILGALHALEPGHGKSFLAAYLVGEKLNIKHLLTLGFSLLITHFLVLILIAVGLKFFFQGTGKEQLFEVAEWLGPALVIGFGLFLLGKYIFRDRKTHVHDHDCGEHLHLPKPALTKTAVVGFMSGLFPCPTAIASLLFAGMDTNFSNAPMYILVYAIGMSIVMLALIFGFYKAKDEILKRFDFLSKKIHPQLLSALLILVIGVVFLAYNMAGHTH